MRLAGFYRLLALKKPKASCEDRYTKKELIKLNNIFLAEFAKPLHMRRTSEEIEVEFRNSERERKKYQPWKHRPWSDREAS